MSAGGEKDQTRSRDLFRGILRAAGGAVEVVLRADRQCRGRYPLQVPGGRGGRDASVVPQPVGLGAHREDVPDDAESALPLCRTRATKLFQGRGQYRLDQHLGPNPGQGPDGEVRSEYMIEYELPERRR